MSTDISPQAFAARGHNHYDSLTRWFDCHQRDELTALNAAMDKSHIMLRDGALSSDAADVMDTLREAARGYRQDLRRDVAAACEPWFRVAR